ncbi:non-ribosomal peptide synthetase [Paraburkholderia sp.]|uniref:non-ribosomal peptide synthetase n=1 Tax=Paraburkholderia sp. TaxID=1926495 RepID=UPI0023A37F1B|nr:non-ribosomal peptide synthetase [Paraburkholderia sp.]MDE1182643.1 amino acid adenylation domain-containing protein [Paraburkholderia sp.]
MNARQFTTWQTGETGLAARLRLLAQQRPDATALIAIDASGEARYDYAELDRRASVLAASFSRDRAAGERALLLMDSGIDYVSAFFGCLYAGVVAVPVYPPESKREQHLARLRGIAQDAGVRYVLTSAALQERFVEQYGELAPGATVVAVDALASRDPGDGAFALYPVQPSDIAFLQYTSGSTGTPKGVMVSHGNLLANEIAIKSGLGVQDDDVFVSWLPLYHDMGLIGSLLQPVFSGIPLVLMSPQYFLERPMRWLDAIARHRGTISGAPDFAYRLCAERIGDDALARLDLSSWRLAFSGSEPVRRDTLDAFVARFAATGFDAAALYPCYGLAEATLFVTGGTRGAGLVSHRFDSASLSAARVVEANGDAASTMLVGCGVTQADHRVAIVDPANGHTLDDGRVGEIHVSGPSIAHGYWQRDDATAKSFVTAFDGDRATRWLRTGDLGFVHDGQLYIAGRAKDLIIVRGRNLYPQDVEQAVEAHCEFARKGRVIAFGAELAGSEGLALALEVAPRMKKRFAPDEIVAHVSRCAFDACGETPSVIVLLNPAALPKTSSGKLQRAATRHGWQDRSLDMYALWERGTFEIGAEQVEAAHAARAMASVQTLDTLDPREAELGALWREVLGAEIGLAPDTHFFAAGGSSLSAARLAVRMSERWGRRFEIGQVFESPTLSAMAAALGDTLAQAEPSREPTGLDAPIEALDPADEPVVSHAQQRQLFAWRLDPDSRAYHIAAGIRLHGALDIDALRHSFDRLSERHPALRTHFADAPETRDTVVPRVRSAEPLPWFEADLCDLHDDDAIERALADCAQRFAAAPFDLLRGPVLRVGLVRYGADRHLLMFALHHIATDGWSMQIVVDEFVAEYRAALDGAQADLAAPSIAYVDYAAWQRRWLDSADARRQLDYWCNELADEATPLNLPFDRAVAAGAAHSDGDAAQLSARTAARVSFSLPAALSRTLRDVASRHRATPFVVLLAAYHAWLYRVTGHGAIRTGVPVANRQRPETQDVVGFFVNTIVLRSDCDAAATLTELFETLRRKTLDGQANQALPFDMLVERLNPARDAQQVPLFDTTFNYLNDDYPALERLPALRATRFEIPDAHVKVPLALDMRESKDGTMRGYLTYASARFDAASVERMATQYLRVVEAFAAALTDDRAAATLAGLDLLGAETRARISADSRGAMVPTQEPTHVPYSGEAVHMRVARHAVTQPDAPAVIDGASSVSYRELDARAQRVAGWLRDRGLQTGELVAIVADRSTAFVVAMIGVLKAGGAYVALDAANPPQRVAQTLRDCGARFVLHQHAERASDMPRSGDADDVDYADDLDGVRHVTIDVAQRHTSDAAQRWPVATDPRDAAYVIYTSGSSGTPKGVVIPHAALTNYVDAVLARLALPLRARFAMVSTVAADLGHTVLFGALATGGALYLVDRDTTLDADRFAHYMATHRIDVLKIVPGHLHALLQADRAADVLPAHTLVLGGEATSWSLLDAIGALRPACRVVNHYGPTETTVGILTQDAAHANRDAAIVPLGRPLDNCATWLLDAHMNPVEAGETGELYLGGAGVARGYLNRAALTAERFVPDPFTPGARLYRSGDRARRLADGTLEYLGRIDDQVKIRGYRVEPGEIAARLRALDGVRDAAVIVVAGARLAGFATPKPGCTLDAAWLKQQLAAALPDYMVPSVLRVIADLPLNRNGKLDRQALAALARPPAKTRKNGNDGHDARAVPQGETEIALARIWSDLLELPADAPPVARDDSFFALGGHSLAAMRLLSRVRGAWAIELPLRAVFTAPSLQAMATAIDGLRGATAGLASDAPIRVVERDAAMPLSMMQQRIWVVDQLAGNALASYNMAAGLDLRGPLDADLLHASLAALVARHEVLRASFSSDDDGDPVLTLAPHLYVPMPVLERDGLDPSDRERTIASLLAEAAQTPFDLSAAPLLRASLIRFDAQHHVLIVALHHIVADGASVHILLDELCAGYRVRRDGAQPTPALPALAVQYADYAVWQRERLTPSAVRAEQDFWRAYLAGAPHFLALPADRPRPARASHDGDARSFTLSAATGARVRTLAAAHGMTPFAVLLASFQAFLHRVTGQADLLIGTDVAGRDRSELEALIGFFINVLPLRSRIADDRANAASFDAWLDASKHATWEALEHRALPFDRIVDAMAVTRRRDANPLLQALFVLRDLPRDNTSVPDLGIELLRPRTTQSKFDMALFVEPVAGGYEVEWVYATALFDASTVANWFDQWRALVDAVTADPLAPLDLPQAGQTAVALTQ